MQRERHVGQRRELDDSWINGVAKEGFFLLAF
jgi:hypothetical protein